MKLSSLPGWDVRISPIIPAGTVVVHDARSTVVLNPIDIITLEYADPLMWLHHRIEYAKARGRSRLAKMHERLRADGEQDRQIIIRSAAHIRQKRRSPQAAQETN